MTIHLLPARLNLISKPGFRFIFFLMLLFVMTDSIAQRKARRSSRANIDEVNIEKIKQLMSQHAIGCFMIEPVLKKQLTGFVMDEKGLPVSFASVMRSDRFGISTDSAGRFLIEVTPGMDSLQFSAAGFNSLTIPVKSEDQEIVIVLSASASLPELVIKSGFYSCTRCRNTSCTITCAPLSCRVKGMRILQSIPASVSQKDLSVYPNPARPGSQVNILFSEPVTATYQVQLFDSKGSLLQKGILVFKNSRSGVYTLNAIAGGSYFLRMTDAKGKTSAVQFIATN